MRTMNTQESTKKFYRDVYMTNGHDYGKFKSLTESGISGNHQLDIVKKCLEQTNIGAVAAVAEIGCGLGLLSSCHPRWIGYEYSSTAVSLSKQLFGSDINIVEADARNLPLPSDSIDFLFSFAALEHIPEVERAFSEIERVLRPGGVALLSPAWNCRAWTVKKLQQRPYSELSLLEKFSKLTIPIRDSLPLRAIYSIGPRIKREILFKVSNRALPLKYKKLEPDFSLWERYDHISDDDAFISMDAHAAIIYFLSRRWVCVSHPSILARLMCRGEEIVFKKYS